MIKGIYKKPIADMLNKGLTCLLRLGTRQECVLSALGWPSELRRTAFVIIPCISDYRSLSSLSSLRLFLHL